MPSEGDDETVSADLNGDADSGATDPLGDELLDESNSPDVGAVVNRPPSGDELTTTIQESSATPGLSAPLTPQYGSNDKFLAEPEPHASGSTAIVTWQGLVDMARDGTYHLENDIDLSGFYESGETWDKFASMALNFYGTFDGQGHTITGLIIEGNVQYAGFFGCLGNGAVIKNLGLEGVDINTTVTSGQAYAGGIAAHASSSSQIEISNCYVEGSVKVNNNSNAYAGGVLGYIDSNNNSAVSYSYHASGAVDAVSGSGTAYAGGVLGYANYASGSTYKSTISSCFNKGSVSAEPLSQGSSSEAYAGGICSNGVGPSGIISNCYNEAAVTAKGGSGIEYAGNVMAGGIAARISATNSGTLSNCENRGAVTAAIIDGTKSDSAYAGGIIAYIAGTIGVTDCLNTGTGTVSAAASSVSAGGVVGEINGASSISGSVNEGNVAVTGTAGIAYAGGICGREGAISACTNKGNVKAESTTSTIYAGGIRGMTGYGAALSECSNEGDVEAKNTGGSYSMVYAGGIFGQFSGNGDPVSNCHNTGAVSAESGTATVYVGGIAGYSEAAIADCSNIGAAVSAESETGPACAGGIGGLGRSISGSHNTGAVEATSGSSASDGGAYAGGIFGRLSGTDSSLADCYNTGAVKATFVSGSSSTYGSAYAGGIFAYLDYSATAAVNQCFNTGVVNAVGNTRAGYAGGIFGYGSSYTEILVEKSYNAGNVSATNTGTPIVYAGGIFAYFSGMATANQCFNTGNVNAAATNSNAYAGGISGRCGTISECYNTGGLSSVAAYSKNVGAICAMSHDYSSIPDTVITNCYWNSDRPQTKNGDPQNPKKGIGDSTDDAGATPLTTAQMKSADSFAGFAFTGAGAVWEFATAPGATYEFPVIKGLPVPPYDPDQPPPTTEKTVHVGAQQGTLIAGTPGTVTYAVTTANIEPGSYAATVANLPNGVTVSGQVAIAGNSGTLTLAGDATTTATTRSNLTLTLDGTTSGHFALTIGAAPVLVTGVTIHPDGLTLEAGARGQLSATVAPAGATDKSLTWASSDPEVVSVPTGASGFAVTVTAHKAGTATVTATATDIHNTSGPKVTKEITVTVVNPYPGSLALTPSYALVAAGESGTVALSHGWDSDKYTRKDLKWAYSKDGAAWSETAPAGFTIGNTLDGKEVKDGIVITVAATATAGAYRVRATAPDGPGAGAALLTATATIEVLG
ncbi:MAG: Ig-like domain-containing protein, partial [Lachnospiraceae bacterium]|nr:Ig-like domain-containing protein [Lachnospiraceae bacterium]